MSGQQGYELRGKNVFITGGSRGLGAVLALTFALAGSNVAINYHSSKEAATKLATSIAQDVEELKLDGVKTVLVRGDAGSTAECKRMVGEAAKKLGGLDIVIANAGWTRFSNFADLDALNEDEWDRCWATNVKGPLALLQAALPIFNTNPEGGVLIATGSIAALGAGGSSMAYSVTKAAQSHLIKCLAKTQGPKIRCNVVLPGLLLTEWGLKYGDKIQVLNDTAVLKHETFLQDCADAYVMLAKNTSMTGQAITVDAGLSMNMS